MKATTQKYSINLTYNIESENSLKAFEEVIRLQPLTPICFSVEIVETEDD